jgi:hypothetical protein
MRRGTRDRGARSWLAAGAAVAVAAVAVATVLLGPARPAGAATWAPVFDHDFPDPSVLDYQGSFYAYSTQVYLSNVPAADSADGQHWTADPANVLPKLPAWASFGDTWSPSVTENASGQLVMFFTARDASLGVQCIGRAVADSPHGPFVDDSPAPFLCDPGAGGSIDPSVFVAGQSYLLWKDNGNAVGQPSVIWAQPLDANLATLSGSPTRLLTDDQPWQDGIVENPAMVASGGALYLFYSGGYFSSSGYGVGVATCTSPLGPCRDGPVNPVLSSAPGMSGPGGQSFFTAPSGQLMMAFAAWPGAVGYAAGGMRALYTAAVSFGADGPLFEPSVSLPSGGGYLEVASDGGIFTFGGAAFEGSAGSLHLDAPIVGMAADSATGGYWLVASDGGIFTYGGAPFEGSMGGRPISAPIVGMAATGDGQGYWLVGADGAVYGFGDARASGSMAGRFLARPIVGMVADPATGGYWLVAADGGVFSFDAPFLGSMGGHWLAGPIVGMEATPDGGGYWLVGADGGIFTFGDAGFYGSMGGHPLNAPVVGVEATGDGRGYRLVAGDGGIFTFGDAGFAGSMGGVRLNRPVVGGATALTP